MSIFLYVCVRVCVCVCLYMTCLSGARYSQTHNHLGAQRGGHLSWQKGGGWLKTGPC